MKRLLCAVLLMCAYASAQQINPNSQISWPTNCSTAGYVYSFYLQSCIPASGGSSGFPFTLGSTSIAANSTTPAVTGLSVNGVTLGTGGASTTFLNGAGAYTTPAGGSSLPTSNALGDTLFASAASSTTYIARTTSKIPVELYGVTPYTSQAAAIAGPDDTANFQAAVTGTVNGAATCQAGKWYHVVGPLNFTSATALIGTSNQTYNSVWCNLVSTSATTNILSAVGVSGTNVNGVTLANLNITRSVTPTGTAAGVYASFTTGMIVTNVRSIDSIYDFYRHASPGGGVGYWSHNTGGWAQGETSGTYRGFYDDSADGNAENSIILVHSSVSCAGLSGAAVGIGQILTGSAINDNDTQDFNTAGCTYGQVANYTGGGGTFASNDIHWITSTHDGVGTSCYKVTGLTLLTDGFLEINGGHCNATTSTSSLVDIENSYGISMRGVDINQHDGFGALHGIYAATDDHLVLANNTIDNLGTSNGLDTPVEFNGVTHSSFTGNTVYADSSNAGNIVWLTGNSLYNSLTGNSLGGFSTGGAGIGIDAGSNNNSYFTNTIDTTHITSGIPIGDVGTNNNTLTSNAPLAVSNTVVAAHVETATFTAPSATVGATCLAYNIFGQAITPGNAVFATFGCVGSGSASNWYGFEFFGNSNYNLQMYPNLGTQFGETTVTTPPASGIAVGTTGQFQVAGTGATTAPTYTASTSVTTPIDNATTVNSHGVGVTALTTPGVPGGTPSTTGGTLAAGTYTVEIAALDGLGNSTPVGTSAPFTTTGSTGSVALTWTAVANATSYKVWLTTGQWFAAATNSFTLTTATGTSGTIPTQNTTGAVSAPRLVTNSLNTNSGGSSNINGITWSWGNPIQIVYSNGVTATYNPVATATSGANFQSMLASQVGASYWNGTNASTAGFGWQVICASGTNPLCTDTLQFNANSAFPTGFGSGGMATSQVSLPPVVAPSFTSNGSNPKIATGTSSNSDMAGHLTFSSGTITFTFANTYTSSPICTANDTTALNPVEVSATTTVLTLTGTGTDGVNYICIGRN